MEPKKKNQEFINSHSDIYEELNDRIEYLRKDKMRIGEQIARFAAGSISDKYMKSETIAERNKALEDSQAKTDTLLDRYEGFHSQMTSGKVNKDLERQMDILRKEFRYPVKYDNGILSPENTAGFDEIIKPDKLKVTQALPKTDKKVGKDVSLSLNGNKGQLAISQGDKKVLDQLLTQLSSNGKLMGARQVASVAMGGSNKLLTQMQSAFKQGHQNDLTQFQGGGIQMPMPWDKG